MLLLFVDECGDTKFKDYLGISVATINHTFYKTIKDGFQKILHDSGWNENIEFKGSYLFSANKGDSNISIETRIEIARKIINLNVSNRNARMRFHYLKHQAEAKCQSEEYLKILPLILTKAIPKATHKNGKDLISVSCDYRNDVKKDDIQNAIMPIIKEKGYTLFEELTMPSSNFNTIGILYADIVGYLTARIDTIKNDIELFENISPEELATNGKIRKLNSSVDLINAIKQLDKYEVKFK